MTIPKYMTIGVMTNSGWIVVSIPGDEDRGDATLWYAYHRDRGVSSPAFTTYGEALAEAQKRNRQ